MEKQVALPDEFGPFVQVWNLIQGWNNASLCWEGESSWSGSSVYNVGIKLTKEKNWNNGQIKWLKSDRKMGFFPSCRSEKVGTRIRRKIIFQVGRYMVRQIGSQIFVLVSLCKGEVSQKRKRMFRARFVIYVTSMIRSDYSKHFSSILYVLIKIWGVAKAIKRYSSTSCFRSNPCVIPAKICLRYNLETWSAVWRNVTRFILVTKTRIDLCVR